MEKARAVSRRQWAKYFISMYPTPKAEPLRRHAGENSEVLDAACFPQIEDVLNVHWRREVSAKMQQ